MIQTDPITNYVPDASIITSNEMAFQNQKYELEIASLIDENKELVIKLQQEELNRLELTNAKQELEFLANTIPQIIWTSNPDGNLDYYNQHWFDYTGMTLAETLGWGWEPVLHPDDLDNCVKIWTESLTTGKPYEVEYRFKRSSDGAYRWHLGRALPMLNDKGEIVKWFGTCTDIDEYKRALNLESTISQFEDFNRIVAHNLRGPAGSIETILEMLADVHSDEERAEFMGMLKQTSKSLNETLDNLMKVLEVRQHKNLPYDECDIYQIFNDLQGMIAGQVLLKHATIITDFKIQTVKFPKIYFASILYNLISNSLKYAKPDVPPHVVITADKVNGKTQIKVSDNGLGIDLLKHGKNVFKLNKVFHRGFDSKGVGLFMTKTQIEAFGGHIAVESEPNVGSTFIIDLK